VDCADCHQQTVVRCALGEKDCLEAATGVGLRFVDPELHLDGKSPLGIKAFEGPSWACHGTEASEGAPAPDMKGRTSVTEIGVGLHEIHHKGGLTSQAVPCESCHVVPVEDKDKGHIDDDLPAEVVFSAMASGKLAAPGLDLKPTWDRKTGVCANTYCHSMVGAEVTKWTWTEKVPGGVGCDSCHGNPPAKNVTGTDHPSGIDCTLCHGTAYKNGVLDLSVHINGKVEL
jgi:predicted CxxxxCH...CXXCH cytochrome family protein